MKTPLKYLTKAATVASLCVAGFLSAAPAQAYSINLPPLSDIQFKYNNLETVVSNVGDSLYGLVNVASLGDPSGTPIYWASGLSGSELTGYFSGLTVQQITSAGGGGDNIYLTGGQLTLYNVPNGTYSPTGPGASFSLTSIQDQICPGGVCPSPWLTFNFVPGVVTTNDPATAFDETTATLFSTVSALTTPLTGQGTGILQVTGGTAAAVFGLGQQMSLKSTLQSCPSADPRFSANCSKAGSWQLASFDPVVGHTIPEPGTLALLGIGLLGVSFVAKKRRQKGSTLS